MGRVEQSKAKQSRAEQSRAGVQESTKEGMREYKRDIG